MMFIAKVLKQPSLGKNDRLELLCHIETFKITVWFCITMVFITACLFALIRRNYITSKQTLLKEFVA